MMDTKAISKIVTMEVIMFREMTSYPDNFFSFDMVVFAELVRETIQKLKSFYKYNPKQKQLLTKLSHIVVCSFLHL